MRVVELVAISACLSAGGCAYDWPLDEQGAGGSGAGAGACDSAIFCHDFEDESIAPPWDRSYVDEGAAVRIEAADAAPSAPNALFTSTAATSEYAYVAHDFRATGTTPTLEAPLSRAALTFAVRGEQLDAGTMACIAGVVFEDGTDDKHSVRLLVGPTGAKLQEVIAGTSTDHALSVGPAPGSWSVLRLAVEAGGRIEVEVDGVTALDIAADASWEASDAVRIVLGINFVEGTGADGFAFHFDDARFDGS